MPVCHSFSAGRLRTAPGPRPGRDRVLVTARAPDRPGPCERGLRPRRGLGPYDRRRTGLPGRRLAALVPRSTSGAGGADGSLQPRPRSNLASLGDPFEPAAADGLPEGAPVHRPLP